MITPEAWDASREEISKIEEVLNCTYQVEHREWFTLNDTGRGYSPGTTWTDMPIRQKLFELWHGLPE